MNMKWLINSILKGCSANTEEGFTNHFPFFMCLWPPRNRKRHWKNASSRTHRMNTKSIQIWYTEGNESSDPLPFFYSIFISQNHGHESQINDEWTKSFTDQRWMNEIVQSSPIWKITDQNATTPINPDMNATVHTKLIHKSLPRAYCAVIEQTDMHRITKKKRTYCFLNSSSLNESPPEIMNC